MFDIFDLKVERLQLETYTLSLEDLSFDTSYAHKNIETLLSSQYRKPDDTIISLVVSLTRTILVGLQLFFALLYTNTYACLYIFVLTR